VSGAISAWRLEHETPRERSFAAILIRCGWKSPVISLGRPELLICLLKQTKKDQYATSHAGRAEWEPCERGTCARCGKPLQAAVTPPVSRPAVPQSTPLECPKCHKAFPAGSKFCGFCGTPLPVAPQATPPQQPPRPIAPQPVAPPIPPGRATSCGAGCLPAISCRGWYALGATATPTPKACSPVAHAARRPTSAAGNQPPHGKTRRST